MSDPIKPVGPPGASASEAVEQAAGPEGAQRAGEGFSVERPAAAGQTGAVQKTDPLQAAIREVAADIRAGIVPDAQAASDAVIIRLVNLRFGHLGEAQRERMLLHLHEVLSNDPQFQARIGQLIETAAAQPAE